MFPCWLEWSRFNFSHGNHYNFLTRVLRCHFNVIKIPLFLNYLTGAKLINARSKETEYDSEYNYCCSILCVSIRIFTQFSSNVPWYLFQNTLRFRHLFSLSNTIPNNPSPTSISHLNFSLNITKCTINTHGCPIILRQILQEN